MLVFQIGMGRTARKSKSSYAAANRTSRSRSARNSPAGEAVIYQRTGGGNVQQSQQQSAGDNQQPSGAGCSQQSGSATLTPELEQVANTVTQRIVPELKDQIVQEIEGLQFNSRHRAEFIR